MNKFACFATSACAMLMLASCGGGDDPSSRILTLEVADYKSPCFGMFAYMCLTARNTGASTYGFFDNIAGFNPQWGRRYVVTVRETQVPNPPADASSVKYDLLRVQQDVPVADDARFTITTPQGGSGASAYITLTSASGGKFIDSTPFTCVSTQVCMDLSDRLTRNVAATLTFSYASPAALPLVLQSVQ